MLFRRWLGPTISKLTMAAQNVPVLNQDRKNKRVDGVNFSYFTVPSTRKAKINFCEFSTKSQNPKTIKNQKVIIYALGSGDFYENHYDAYQEDAKKYPQAKIAAFNFRNVQKSTGVARSENDWIDDTIAVVNFYRSKGIPIENILLSGHSLGGAIVTMAAAKLYEEALRKAQYKRNIKSVKIINNRSFSTLTNQVISIFASGIKSGFISAAIYGSLTLVVGLCVTTLMSALATCAIVSGLLIASGFVYNKLPESLLKPVVGTILWLTFGTMDALSAYKKLPTDAKDYITAKNDDLIPLRPSLHLGLRPLRLKQKQLLKDKIEQGGKGAKNALDKLIDLKDSKLHYPNHLHSYVEHMADPAMLQTYHKCRSERSDKNMPQQITGEQVLENKMQRLLKI